MFDEGSPPDWHLNPGGAQRVGLSSGGPYRILAAKVAGLAALCSNYNGLKSLLSLDFRNDVKISIVSSSGSTLLNCGPSVATTIIPEFPITRYALLETNEIVRISVSLA